jgi:hypothetical protein
MVDDASQTLEVQPALPIRAMIKVLLMSRRVQMLVKAAQLVELPVAEIAFIGESVPRLTGYLVLIGSMPIKQLL